MILLKYLKQDGWEGFKDYCYYYLAPAFLTVAGIISLLSVFLFLFFKESHMAIFSSIILLWSSSRYSREYYWL